MSENIQGGCLCGESRYVTASPVAFSIICCCRQCQQITGTGHAPQFALARGAVTISGPLKSYELQAESGNHVQSFFCGNCGSPVYKGSSGYTDFWFFHAGTLDEPQRYQPQQIVWARRKQRWDQLDPALPVHD